MATIAEEKGVWILAKKANPILGFPEGYTRISNVLNAAGVRSKKLPRAHPRYYLPDIEKLRDQSIRGGDEPSEEGRRNEKASRGGSLVADPAARHQRQN